MFRSKIMLLLILLLTSGVAVALQESGEEYVSANLEQEKQLGVTFDLTYVSKWLSKGAEGYGSKGGLFETVDVDLYGTGFGFKVSHRNATSSGYVNSSRFDYRPYYKNKLFEGTSYVMNYNISVGYEHYYKVNSNNANTTWEWVFAFAWPKLIGHGFVPKYIAHYEYPAHNNDNFRHKAGWAHRFILIYNAELEQLPKPLCLSIEMTYNDGLGGVPSDWSYLTLGMGTEFNITDNVTFVPGIYHQVTMDNSINKHKDVTYCKLSMKYKF